MTMYIEQDDDRYDEFVAFEKEHGFSPDECWNLDVTFAQFMLPRIKHYKENGCTYPVNLTENEWNEILSRMIETFELMSSEENFNIGDSEISEKIDIGLDLFREYIRNMWD